MERTEEQTCANCGCDMESDHAYCRRCGASRGNNDPLNNNQDIWTCMTCGRQVPTDFSFCPHCGRPAIIPYHQYMVQAPQPEYPDDPTLVHFILFSISFLVPLIGFVLGYVLTRPDHSSDERHAGRICFLLAFIWPFLALLFLVRVFLIA